jgi:hypothetical protein
MGGDTSNTADSTITINTTNERTIDTILGWGGKEERRAVGRAALGEEEPPEGP